MQALALTEVEQTEVRKLVAKLPGGLGGGEEARLLSLLRRGEIARLNLTDVSRSGLGSKQAGRALTDIQNQRMLAELGRRKDMTYTEYQQFIDEFDPGPEAA